MIAWTGESALAKYARKDKGSVVVKKVMYLFVNKPLQSSSSLLGELIVSAGTHLRRRLALEAPPTPKQQKELGEGFFHVSTSSQMAVATSCDHATEKLPLAWAEEA